MSMLAPSTAADPRVPPHNLEAEQSTLGGMLLSQEAVAEVVEEVSSFDFYAGKHELIFNAIVNLFGKGEPTDVIAVTDELNKQGNLLKAGGSDYLHSLASYVPTAAAAGYYASIVAEKAILRRLIEAGTRIAQSGYESQGEVVDLVNQAQADLYKVASQSSKEDYVGLSESLEAAIHEIEVAQNRGGELTGTPTGFTDLDAYTHGFTPDSWLLLRPGPRLVSRHLLWISPETHRSSTTKRRSSSRSKWVGLKSQCECSAPKARFTFRACVKEQFLTATGPGSQR